MRKHFILTAVIVVLFFASNFCWTQEEAVTERLLVLREAKQYGETNVAVQAYLVGDILEVTVSARIYAAKPEIDNVIIVGPKLGRLSPKTKKTLYATEEEEEPYLTTESKGLIGFGRKKRTKKAKGTLTKELFKFNIPRNKIIPGKRYELRIRIESMKIAGKFIRFKFELKNLPQLILQ